MWCEVFRECISIGISTFRGTRVLVPGYEGISSGTSVLVPGYECISSGVRGY